MSESRAHPHDPIESIGEDVFMVRGSIALDSLMRITRNMARISIQGRFRHRRYLRC